MPHPVHQPGCADTRVTIMIFVHQVSSNDSSTAGDADSPEKPKLLQQSNGLEDICRPIVDQVKAWEGIAAAQFGLEGGMDGWDSDTPDPESSEDKYLKACLAKPFIWKVILTTC